VGDSNMNAADSELLAAYQADRKGWISSERARAIADAAGYLAVMQELAKPDPAPPIRAAKLKKTAPKSWAAIRKQGGIYFWHIGRLGGSFYWARR